MRRFILPAISLCLLTFCVGFMSSVPAGAEPWPAAEKLSQQASGPAAVFTMSSGGQTGPNLNVPVHQAVVFDAGPSQGGLLGYTWTFGDGSPPASGQKVSHSFGLVDDYTVTLTVGNAAGQTASSTQPLRVAPYVQALVSDPPMKQIAIAAVVPVTLYVQAPGPGAVNAALSGDLISGKPVPFSTPDALAYITLTGQVANESNAAIDQQVIQTPGGGVPLKGNVGVELTYKSSAGNNVDLVYTLDLQKDLSPTKGIWSITYPNFSLVTGATDTHELDTAGYYLKGDPNFHHPDDPLVRKYAMSIARAGGALSDDPTQVMENIYSYVSGLLGSDDPAQLESDTAVVQKIASGSLVPGARSQKYICISQTYFLASLTRTLGLASRELTIALANPVRQNASGTWTVDYVQEGATEVWYDSSWHLYDTWLHIRNLDDYLAAKYAYQAWYSYSPQNYQLVAKNGDPLGLYGHDFAIGEIEGTPSKPDMWYGRAAKQRSGVLVEGFPTS